MSWITGRMTVQQQSTLKQAVDVLTALAAVVVLLGAVGGGLAWLAGGFQPQTQVQVQQLSVSVTGLGSKMDALGAKMDALPRLADYTSLVEHLSRHDGQITVLIDRVTRDEIDSAATRQEVRALRDGTNTPVRQPR